MIDRFDHVTISIREIEAGIAEYTALLGSAPIWRGAHPELGTHAALFALSNALIELVAPDADAPEAEGLRAHLEAHGEGLQALAFGTPDAAALSAALRGRGLRATPPQPGEAHGQDGAVRAYRTVELSARSTRGLSVFAVERADLELLRAASEPSSDAMHALDHVVIRTGSPDAAIALYGEGLGIRLALDREVMGTRMLFFRVGGVTVEVVHDPTLGEIDRLWGLAYRVRDIDRAHQRLTAAGLGADAPRDGRKPSTRVFSLHSGSAQVPTLILYDPARA